MTTRQRLARRIVLGALRRGTRGGRLTICEADGPRHEIGGGDGGVPLHARVDVHDPSFWPGLLRGSLGLGLTYRDGVWSSPDLVALIRVAARSISRLDDARGRVQPLLRPIQAAASLVRRNTARRSRRQIAAHYDLGNDLYRVFLDETMMYSAAVFKHPGQSLHDAQLAKLDRVCRKLALGPDDHLLEIGTGWGAMAVHAATHYGCRVTTTTISAEQHAVATERVRAAGLGDRITVLMEDYRHLTGTFDKLVSIEMIEAVGWRDFDTYFRVCSERLKPDGLMLLQAITIDARAYDVEKASKTFINQLIFPGGCLPSQEIMARSMRRHTDLRVVQLEDITGHYVRTLQAWRENFLGATQALDDLGYDEHFRRLWDLYLSYCEAGFAERRIHDVQMLLAKPRFAAEPAVEAPLYDVVAA